ncbi:MAG: TPM domain-containing protein [Desulfuromonadaceae bacterium]
MNIKRFVIIGLLVALGAVALLSACRNRQEPSFVDDQAGLLQPEQLVRINRFHDRLLQDLDIHCQLTILAEPAMDLEQTALQLVEQLQLGKTPQGARGVLLLIDPTGQQMRIEIGYDLEGIFPDGFVGYLEREQMTPFFAAGRVADGIEATVELLVARALGEISANPNKLPELPHLSGGGGARSTIAIGTEIPTRPVPQDRDQFAAQPSPRQTLLRYIDVLRQFIKDPELGIYTPDSRIFLRQWLVTNAQQTNERQDLERSLPRIETRISADLAVLRFPIDTRQTPPYLLRRADDGWQLDLAAMHQLIGFNHKNQWFFRSLQHEFMFAFADLKFDANGFPHH